MQYYRLYAKLIGQPKFKAIDIDRGIQVNNLIFATMVPQERLGVLKELVKLESTDNPNVQFKIKKIK